MLIFPLLIVLALYLPLLLPLQLLLKRLKTQRRLQDDRADVVPNPMCQVDRKTPLNIPKPCVNNQFQHRCPWRFCMCVVSLRSAPPTLLFPPSHVQTPSFAWTTLSVTLALTPTPTHHTCNPNSNQTVTPKPDPVDCNHILQISPALVCPLSGVQTPAP